MRPDIAGLQNVTEYLEPEAHDRLLAAVDLHPWQMTVYHGVQVYSYHYNHAKRAAYRICELPPWANDLAMRLCRDGFVPATPDQLVAND